MKSIGSTILVLGLAILVWPGSARGGEPGQLVVSAEQRAALGIEVGSPERLDAMPLGAFPARVGVANEAHEIVTARLEGVLVEASVAVGDVVAAGTVLARIESPAYVSLQRALLDATSDLEVARSAAERDTTLATEGIIPGRRALRSQASLEQARALVRDHEEGLRLAGAREGDLDRLRASRRLEPRLAVRSSTSGPVLEQLAKRGERLLAGDPLYRVADRRGLTLEIHAPIGLASRVGAGTEVRIEEPEGTARVVSVGRNVDPGDQGVVVRAAVTEGSEVLLPGQFVRARFLRSATQAGRGISVWSVPATAVVHRDDRAWIFEERNGGFVPLEVRAHGRSADRIVVEAEIAEGAGIVVRGTAALKSLWLARDGGTS